MRDHNRAGSFDRVFNNRQKDAQVKAETQKTSATVVIALAFLTLVLSLLYLLSQPAAAQGMAYKQAIAEAAAKDRDLAGFYQSTGYSPVWTRDDAIGQARRQALFRALETVEMHGLPAARYDTQTLMTTLQDARNTRDLGFAEVAMSKMFLRLSRDMQTGLLTPGDVVNNIKREVPYRDRKASLAKFQAGDPFEYFRTLAPQSNEYARLMKAKLQLETRVAEGGWGEKVSAKSLKPGATGPSVVALRNRLVRKGFMPRSVTQSYDRGIEAAVRSFQEQHGLEPDGIANKATLQAINVSAADRLKSVIVAMERERWLNFPGGKGERHILVNLTDFSARIMDNDHETFRTRAVIGMHKDGRRSPEFSDEMEHMVINPTWHVPRSIAVKEYLPKLRANPNALGHLRVVNSKGQTVSRGSANFAAYSARTFPFALKQPPSPRNALGLVKFMFPNKYNIYLHDTPHKDLFSREVRAYSHGCIRLADPFDFAYEILSKQEADPKAAFHNTLDTGKETYVHLDTHVPVHIIYRTAVSDAKGVVRFRSDVYGRDAKIWSALERAGVSLNAVQG